MCFPNLNLKLCSNMCTSLYCPLPAARASPLCSGQPITAPIQRLPFFLGPGPSWHRLLKRLPVKAAFGSNPPSSNGHDIENDVARVANCLLCFLVYRRFISEQQHSISPNPCHSARTRASASRSQASPNILDRTPPFHSKFDVIKYSQPCIGKHHPERSFSAPLLS